jgi:hypothetical protein
VSAKGEPHLSQNDEVGNDRMGLTMGTPSAHIVSECCTPETVCEDELKRSERAPEGERRHCNAPGVTCNDAEVLSCDGEDGTTVLLVRIKSGHCLIVGDDLGRPWMIRLCGERIGRKVVR